MTDLMIPAMNELPPTPMSGPATRWVPPTAAEVKKRWEECTDDLLENRRNFVLNDAFHHGDQWLKWNNNSASAEILDFFPDAPKTRATVNKLKPRTTGFMARLLRTPLSFEPRANGIDSSAIKQAKLERQVLTVSSHRRDWEQVRRDEVFYALLGGVSAVAIEADWDMADEPVQDGDGQWVTLPERPAVKASALSVLEFGIEPGSRATKDARWWIRGTTLTPKQVKERYPDAYPTDSDPEADGNAALLPMHSALLGQRTRGSIKTKVCQVLVYYERPTKVSPGCVLHVVGGRVVQQHDWPFPFKDRLNVVTYRQADLPSTWKGDTFLNDARQIQVTINQLYTSIKGHIGKADNARMLLPHGAVLDGDDDMSGEAAEKVYYDSNVGEPHWMLAPQIPRWLREHIDELIGDLDDTFSSYAAARGQQVGDRNSGLALSILAEKADTPLGMMAGDQQRGWQTTAELVLMTERGLLELADEYKVGGVDPQTGETIPMQVTDYIANRSTPTQHPEQVTWTAKDLSKRPVVYVPLDSVMPTSQAAVQDMMLKLAANPVFGPMFAQLGPSQLAAMLQVPDPFAFTQVANPWVQEAQTENQRMIAGAGEEEVKIQVWQDHDVHLVEHNRTRAAAEYRDADPEIQQFIDWHCDAHVIIAQQLAMAQASQQASGQIGPEAPAPGGPQPAGGQPAQPGGQA